MENSWQTSEDSVKLTDLLWSWCKRRKTRFSLSDFVGQRSTVLFNLLNIPVTFLQDSEWHLWPEYSAVKKIIKNFSPLNDSCERVLGMATRFNSKIARTEEGFEELMQVVEAHRRKFSVKTKSDLQSFY